MNQSDAERSSLEGLSNFLRNRRKLLVSSRAGAVPAGRRRPVASRPTHVVQSHSGTTLMSDFTDVSGRMTAAAESSPLAAIDFAMFELRESAVVRYDVFGSPLRWNATADGLFRWSSDADPFSRNSVVAGLTNAYYRDVLGCEFEPVFRSTVRRFLRAYRTGTPSAFAQRIYAFAAEQAEFRAIWDEDALGRDPSRPGPLVHVVPEVGTLRLDQNDVAPLRKSDCFIRFLTPHDVETRRKLAVLSHMGKSSKFVDHHDR